MTALAAIMAESGATRRLQAMLDGQALYGSGTRQVEGGDTVALGIQPYAFLPEDMFDRQPYRFAEGRFTLIADLRLDNRAALLADLRPGSDPASISDADIAAIAFDAWGVDSFDRLRGDFAIAIHDATEQRFILARDGFGTRPLYFHQSDGLVAIASMPKGLNALDAVPRAPDLAAIEASLVAFAMVGDSSHWKGIRRVLAGHYAIIDAVAVRQVRYWHPAKTDLGLTDHRDYAAALRAQIDRAVAVRLRGARRVATHLSAGLDSGTVTATTALQLRDQGGRVTAYTAAPVEGYAANTPRGLLFDESDIAAETAGLHANIDHVVLRSGNEWAPREVERNFQLADSPAINLCNMVWINAIHDDMRQRGLSVLLPASLGNLTMTMSPEIELVAALLQKRYRDFAVELARSWPLGPRTLARSALNSLTFAGPPLLKRLLAPASVSPSRDGYHLPQVLPGSDIGSLTLFSAWRFDIGLYHKAAVGGWGIDIRDPTMDRDLFEFALSIPARQHRHGGMPRALIRTAMAGRMGASALQLKLRGRQGADWHIGATRNLGWLREQAEIAHDTEAVRALIDTERLLALTERWPTGGWQDPEVFRPYRVALLRSLSLAHFIRRAGGSNR